MPLDILDALRHEHPPGGSFLGLAGVYEKQEQWAEARQAAQQVWEWCHCDGVTLLKLHCTCKCHALTPKGRVSFEMLPLPQWVQYVMYLYIYIYISVIFNSPDGDCYWIREHPQVSS